MQSPDNSQPQFPLSPEERDKFKSCLEEFSFSSTLPYVFAGGIAGYIGPLYFGKVRTGLVCSTVGIFAGIAYAKYKHLKSCFERMMTNPAFAARYKSFMENKGSFPMGAYPPAIGIPRPEEYPEQYQPQREMTPTIDQTYDTVPLFSEDISTRKDKFVDQDKELDSLQLSSTRYDELRRRNREEYYRNQGQVTQPYKPLPPVGQTEEVPKVYEPEDHPKTTKYGDIWA